MSEALPEEIIDGYAGLQRLAFPRSALSLEAEALRETAEEVIDLRRRSQALFGARDAILSELWSMVGECEDPGWDGEGAEPVSEWTAELAEVFIRVLPDDVPLPELSPEPDGSISLDWIRSRHRQLSLSIGSSHRLAYAWVDGGDRGHAVSAFDGERIPTQILSFIRAIRDWGFLL